MLTPLKRLFRPARAIVARSRIRRARGFTLIEMLVVISIIGMLAALIGPNLLGRVETSKVTAAEVQVKQLKGALDTMRLDIGRYPTKDEGLDLLMNAPKDERLGRRWRGPYLSDAVPLDPWNNPYQYNSDGSSSILLYSFGADGKSGGEGVNADIGLVPKAAAQP